jgi:hypothetical protein
MIDHVLNYLRSQSDAPVLVGDYCNLNYGMTWRDLQRSENTEWITDVLDLIEAGELRVLTVGTGALQ